MNEVFQTSIDFACNRTKFDYDEKEMTELLNLEIELQGSSNSIGLHLGLVIPRHIPILPMASQNLST